MAKPKWIIQGTELRISVVDMHWELLRGKEKHCAGGGLWNLDKDNKTIHLWGQSTDFGQVTKEQVIDCDEFDSRLKGYDLYWSNDIGYNKDLDEIEFELIRTI